MSSWSQKRRLIYLSIAAIVAVGAVGLPLFLRFYKPPSCFDGVKNGNEQGVDCGGSCQKLCPDAFIPARADWVRFEKMAPGVYNLAAYIVNPNVAGGAHDVPFHIVLFDSSGVPISDVSGTVTIPPHRNTLAFIPNVDVKKSVPIKAIFEFTAPPDWTSETDPLGALSISDLNYTEGASGSSFQATLSNSSVQPIGPLEVYAVLYDKDHNAVGFSKTIVDQVPPGGSAVAPFTWPIDRNGAVISQEVLPVAE
ncbi:MAG: hypothetical protein KGI45_02625 [Patescibacteria group bacterium]|nr:hypothetical protein [Patescibacteria group bacterium]MDE1940672.1 hypothetical protein [Patescibacteria group bacterium]MDE1966947.1 hypothetical protein [Patescibacteria group bacterium]